MQREQDQFNLDEELARIRNAVTRRFSSDEWRAQWAPGRGHRQENIVTTTADFVMSELEGLHVFVQRLDRNVKEEQLKCTMMKKKHEEALIANTSSVDSIHRQLSEEQRLAKESVKKVQREKGELEDEIEELKKILDDNAEEIRQLNDEVRSHKKMLDDAMAEKKAVDKKVAKMEDEIKMLRNDLVEGKQQNDAEDHMLQKAEEENQRLSRKCQDVENELKQEEIKNVARQAVDHMMHQLESAEKDQKVENQLKETHEKLEKVEKELKESREQNKVKDRKLREANAGNIQISKRLQNAKNKRRAMKQFAAGLRKSFLEKKAESRAKSIENSEAERESQRLESELREEIRRLIEAAQLHKQGLEIVVAAMDQANQTNVLKLRRGDPSGNTRPQVGPVLANEAPPAKRAKIGDFLVDPILPETQRQVVNCTGDKVEDRVVEPTQAAQPQAVSSTGEEGDKGPNESCGIKRKIENSSSGSEDSRNHDMAERESSKNERAARLAQLLPGYSRETDPSHPNNRPKRVSQKKIEELSVDYENGLIATVEAINRSQADPMDSADPRGYKKGNKRVEELRVLLPGYTTENDPSHPSNFGYSEAIRRKNNKIKSMSQINVGYESRLLATLSSLQKGAVQKGSGKDGDGSNGGTGPDDEDDGAGPSNVA